MKYNIGFLGLGVMGQNLALNIERNGYSVVGYDLDPAKQKEAARKFSAKKFPWSTPSKRLLCILNHRERL